MEIKQVKQGYFNLAICSVFLKDYQDAQININKYLQIEENDVEGYFIKGVVEYNLKNYDDAI